MVTNTDEGFIFVSGNLTSQMTVEQYVADLMPTFNKSQVQRVADLYKGVGFETVFDQASAIMGECECSCKSNDDGSRYFNALSDIRLSHIYASQLLQGNRSQGEMNCMCV